MKAAMDEDKKSLLFFEIVPLKLRAGKFSSSESLYENSEV